MAITMSPTVRGWELGIRLRERRNQVGLTASAAAREAGCTQAYLSGVESGRVKITEDKLDQVLGVYDVDERERADLQQMRAESLQRGWWHQYAKILKPEFVRYLGFAEGAASVRVSNTDLVFGPLQTEDYARATVLSSGPYIRLTEVDRRVQSRLARRDRIFGPTPPRIIHLLSEAALRQQVGGPAVMRGQLDHLATIMCEHGDHIEIRVIPFTVGAHPTTGSSFEILSFDSELLPDLVWQEVVTSQDMLEGPDEVVDYVVGFEESAQKALSAGDSLDLIRRVSEEMR